MENSLSFDHIIHFVSQQAAVGLVKGATLLEVISSNPACNSPTQIKISQFLLLVPTVVAVLTAFME
jgi:hypothetical protein